MYNLLDPDNFFGEKENTIISEGAKGQEEENARNFERKQDIPLETGGKDKSSYC